MEEMNIKECIHCGQGSGYHEMHKVKGDKHFGKCDINTCNCIQFECKEFGSVQVVKK